MSELERKVRELADEWDSNGRGIEHLHAAQLRALLAPVPGDSGEVAGEAAAGLIGVIDKAHQEHFQQSTDRICSARAWKTQVERDAWNAKYPSPGGEREFVAQAILASDWLASLVAAREAEVRKLAAADGRDTYSNELGDWLDAKADLIDGGAQ